jgi:hypothetical protein
MLLVLVRLQSYPELNAVPVRNIAYDCLTANDCLWSAVVMPRLTTWRNWLTEHSQDVHGVVSMAARLIRVCAVSLRSGQWLARGWFQLCRVDAACASGHGAWVVSGLTLLLRSCWRGGPVGTCSET